MVKEGEMATLSVPIVGKSQGYTMKPHSGGRLDGVRISGRLVASVGGIETWTDSPGTITAR